jgi:Tfp pilus assembly protein PilV
VSGRAVSLLGFAALLAAAVALEVAGRRRGHVATAGQALAGAMRTTGGRVAVLSCWLWGGVHFLAR